MRCLPAVVPLLFVLTSCGADDEGDALSIADGSIGDAGEPASGSGPLMCPAGSSCTLIVASQAFDDRVEIFAARGPGPVYRGAIDVDLKRNPGGNNEGENLDEPYGVAMTSAGLAVLIGHYPKRNRGSLIVFPHEVLSGYEVGATIPAVDYFVGDEFTSAVFARELGEEEPIFALTHPSGRLLIGSFANDLFTAETEWTAPGKLLVVDPGMPGAIGRRVLDDVGGGRCTGAWSLIALDAEVNRVALACDGNEGAVVLDVSRVGEGTVQDAAATIEGCVADVPFPNKRVRSIAEDGTGGFLLVEHAPVATGEEGRMYRFASDCSMLAAPGSIPGSLFEIRQIVRLSGGGGDGARWLMASGRTSERGIHVIRDSATGAEICGRLVALDEQWRGDDGRDLHPYALALEPGGRGLAIGAGPIDPGDDEPGFGRVVWVELDPAIDPCEASPVTATTDLTASAPAVDAADPFTWRRAPNVLFIQRYGVSGG